MMNEVIQQFDPSENDLTALVKRLPGTPSGPHEEDCSIFDAAFLTSHALISC